MRNLKANSLTIAGNVASVDIKASNNGNNEYFGTISLALDDGYFKKGQNGQGGEWVDRTHFVDVKVDNRIVSAFKHPVEKGDQVAIEGKLIQERWQDPQGGNRSAIRIRATSVTGHVRKAEIEALKMAGLIGNPNQVPQQAAPAQHPQHPPQNNGYAPAPQHGGNQQQPQAQQYNQQPQQQYSARQNY